MNSTQQIAKELKDLNLKSYIDITSYILNTYTKSYDKYHIIVDGEIVDIEPALKQSKIFGGSYDTDTSNTIK